MAIELLTPFTKVELEPEIKDKKRKQVGILGGNFNPVHNAHLIVADKCANSWDWIKFCLCLNTNHLT